MDKQNEQNELERIKEESGLSWRKFAESFGIPYRTVQDWHLGNRPMRSIFCGLWYTRWKQKDSLKNTEWIKAVIHMKTKLNCCRSETTIIRLDREQEGDFQ